MIKINLNHENVILRVIFAYIIFFVLIIISFGIGFFILSEGIMKNIPFFSLVGFNQSTTFLNLILQTLLFNLFFILLIILANHYQVKQLNLGYLPLFANVIILGLFAGTNSFSGNLSSYTIEGLLVFFRVGFLEFSAYILICCATVKFTMFYAEKWRGEEFKKIRKLREIALSKKEILFIIIAIILLIIAAINEWLMLFQ